MGKQVKNTQNGTVYVHITPNSKMYIGVTSLKFYDRCGLNGNGYKHCTLFWKAIQKYGWDNIQHIILIDSIPYDLALLVEQELIKKYKTNDHKHGYNLTGGGEGMLGYVFTDEQLKNHKNWLGRHHSEETKRKISKINKGRKYTEEQRRAKSELMKGRPSAFKGKHHTAEAKAKLSAANMGCKRHCTPHTEETKRKLSIANKGRKVSLETREKLRQKALEQWKRQKSRQQSEKSENL